uniref:Unannotated protein n=1 Tax=freshwater metagenome TaxID=449393 RepID=A0A6J5ZYB9_9ZZZZ
MILPALAGAKTIEMGDIPSTVKPTCPRVKKKCNAVTRTTVYPSSVGTNHSPMVVPRNGRLVAWTVKLGTPISTDRKWFDKNAGGVSQAKITILQRVKGGGARVVKQGESAKLQAYFGKTAQFALLKSIYVKKGQIIALTVPTWAPVLAYGFDNTMAWRASRAKGQCGVSDYLTPHEQLAVKSFSTYYCSYKTSRLTYSVTLIPAL